MTQTFRRIDHPTLLDIGQSGSMAGSSRRYEKTQGDMAGVYRDNDAWEARIASEGPSALVYTVNEQKYHDGSGALIVGTSTLLPGTCGDEYAVTRGHLHSVSDRAELYYCLAGHGVMLLETVEGLSEAVELTAGQAVNVPGEWIHRSVNVGGDPFVTLFCYAADAGQNYGIIADAGGMKQLVVHGEDGWKTVANPQHTGYKVEVES